MSQNPTTEKIKDKFKMPVMKKPAKTMKKEHSWIIILVFGLASAAAFVWLFMDGYSIAAFLIRWQTFILGDYTIPKLLAWALLVPIARYGRNAFPIIEYNDNQNKWKTAWYNPFTSMAKNDAERKLHLSKGRVIHVHKGRCKQTMFRVTIIGDYKIYSSDGKDITIENEETLELSNSIALEDEIAFWITRYKQMLFKVLLNEYKSMGMAHDDAIDRTEADIKEAEGA